MRSSLVGVCLPATRERQAGNLIAAALLLLLGLPLPLTAAPFKVYSPRVTKGENEIEYRGFRDIDDSGYLDGGQAHLFAIGRGFTDTWFSELYSVHEKEPGGSLEHTGFEWENLFQLTEPGQYWADFGFLLEYEFTRHDNPDEFAVAPIAEKAVGPWVGTLNLFLEREIGSGRAPGTTLAYAARVKYLLDPRLEPALELFGEPGRIGHFGSFDDQQHWAGPAFYGSVGVGRGSKLNYSAAYLFAGTPAASDNRVVLRLEFEFF